VAEAFDPYYIWLGIRPEEQPPNLYRLLGLPPFEDNHDAIENAADARMMLLRTLQAGRNAQAANRLLNEVSSARVRLLDPQKRAAYDQQLRAAESQPAETTVLPEIPSSLPRAAAGPQRPDSGPSADAESGLGQLGEYRLLEKLGEGGMGAVFKALHTKLGRVVALKILPRDRIWDEKALMRFDREMKAVGALDHPNIIRAMDAREVEGTRFLVTEYVDGADLNLLGRQCHPLSIADVCEIVRQAAVGLQEAHRHGLVHRDVKPSNFMVTTQGVVRLLDLGLARFESDQTPEEVTGTGQPMGTIEYMAPEQISDSHKADIRADIYGLGCTFYKLLAGRTPFGGPQYKSILERMAAHARDPVPPIRELRPDVPDSLVELLDRMLAKDPGARPSTPAEVAEAVGPFATGSNLAALVARAMGRPAPADSPAQASTTTEGYASATPMEFTEWLEIDAKAPSSRPPPLPQPASRKLIAAIVALIAVIATIFTAIAVDFFSSRPVVQEEAVLVLDWPEAERREATLLIDQNEVALPPSGPFEYRCSPGTHTIAATRPGFRPYHETVTVGAGVRQSIAVVWGRQAHLTLKWPPRERVGASLQLDGRPLDLARLSLLALGGEIQLPLKPGRHTVVINRPGFEPFSKEIEIDEEKNASIRPEWKRSGAMAQSGKAGTPKSSGEVTPAPKPKPSEPKAPVPEPPKPPAQEPAMVAKSSPSQPPVATAPEETKPRGPSEAEKRQAALDARFAEALAPVEGLVVNWKFKAAGEATAGVRFAEPELAARLAQRQQEIKRLDAIKSKIIETVNTANPPLKKTTLGIKGIGGDLVKADEEGVTANLISGKTETYAWGGIAPKASIKLMQLAIDRSKADDWLAAGLLAIVCQDSALGAKCLEQAQSLGAAVDVYLDGVAGSAFARAKGLMRDQKFAEAERLLADIEEKYSKTRWFAANKRRVAEFRSRAKAGIVEGEAEGLYAQAAACFENGELFDLRPIVEKLKADFPRSAAVTDAARRPSVEEMQKAVAELGKRFLVRRDGRGDFKSIQEALDAALPNSLVEIQDNGPYNERIHIAKDGIVLRGKRGVWPIVTSSGPVTNFPVLVTITARRVSLDRLVLNHAGVAGRPPHCVHQSGGDGPAILNSVLYGGNPVIDVGPGLRLDGCVAIGRVRLPRGLQCRNTVFIAPGNVGLGPESKFENVLFPGDLALEPKTELRGCHLGKIEVHGEGVVILDSTLVSVQSARVDTRIERCNVYGTPPFIDQAKPGTGCFPGSPQFVDPKNLDFRMLPSSPCIRKASDGGDVGFRYTSPILDMMSLVFRLRSQGYIKF